METMEVDGFNSLATIDEMIAIVEGRVEGKTWIKGESIDQMVVNGRPVLGMCLGGMFRHLSVGTVQELMDVPPWVTMASYPLVMMVGKVILEQYPDRVPLGSDPGAAVVPFNDHPDTMNTDVVRVLEKTRVALVEAV
jgi:hypothetical protein